MGKNSKQKTNGPVMPKTGFTSADTRFIKGFAILLLMWHHLCNSPGNYYLGTTFPPKFIIAGKSLTMWFAKQGNISVTIFAFLGGYAIYKCFERPHFFTNKLWSLYKNYWKIFFVFVPIGFMFFAHQEQYCEAGYTCGVFSNFDLTGFVYTLVGLSCSYNIEWWFFFFYVKAVLIGLVFVYLNKKRNSCFVEIGEILIFMFLFQALSSLSYQEGFDFLRNNAILNDYFSKIEVLACVLLGTVFGKYDILLGLINWIHSLPLFFRKFISVAAIIIILVCRNEAAMDYVFVPALIPALYELFGYTSFTQKCMGFVGKHSSNMYYMHTFLIFYYGAVARLIYKPNNSFVSFLIFVASCLVLSIVINKFYEILYKIAEKIHLLDRLAFAQPQETSKIEKTEQIKVDAPSASVAEEKIVNKDEPENVVTVLPRKDEITDGETVYVDDYKAPVVCSKCGNEVILGKQFGMCNSCGIYYVRNKYRNDQTVIGLIGDKSIVWIKKR
ncbi:MAG: acyltransferase [Lachnospiraceae bacterium]|nr:acyltransferase [Lachnospiraceae bacterium]